MLWILVLLIGLAVLIHLGTRGESARQELERLQAEQQKARDRFEARFGRKPSSF